MTTSDNTATVTALDPAAAMQRLGQGACDALTDEMIGRLSETVSGGLTLLDQINRSGLDKAIPVLASMTQNGDLERIAQMARLLGSAQDAVTDEMIGRLSETVSGGMTLIDQINRSGLDKVIPVLAQMVDNGDLERIAQMARLLGSAQDALTDEMVGRLTEMVSGGMTLLDQVNRHGAARLINILTRLETVEAMLEGVQEAAHAVEREPTPAGLRGWWKMITDRDNRKVMQFFMAVGKELQRRCSTGC